MIENSTYQKSWIEERARTLGKVDRKLLEKVIMALALVEQLRAQQMEFILKGGTTLVLLLEQPRRFSIDVDIILPEKLKSLNTIFNNIIEQSPFTRWVADNERKSKTNIPVEHYKFFYQSAVDQYVQEEPILLDILYADNYYPELKNVSIRHPWLVTDEPYMSVSIPTLESILGDKLTAFAPNTTGILYEKNRPVEIIKQLYDIGTLFDLVEQLDIVKTSFEKMAADEIRYRELNIISDDILQDVFETALTISIRDENSKHFQHLRTGISNIFNFIFVENFRIEQAIIYAARAAYLSQLLTTNVTSIPNRLNEPADVIDWNIETPEYQKLNKLKKTIPEAFYYWYHAIGLLNK